MRHGARTPWGNTLNCWDDYWTNPDTAIWDCNLTAYLAPPPPARVTEEGADAGTGEAMFLFEKRYDAFVDRTSQSGFLSNFLNGTCQVGQLLLQGYQQEVVNGQHLREAYVFNSKSGTPHNPRMQLLDVGKEKEHLWDKVHYRVDDEARTLMSGQLIMRGLLGPEMEQHFAQNHEYPVIPLHTADFDRDVMDPNESICPRLREIRERNEESMDFKLRIDNTHEANTLRQFMHNVLKVPQADADMDTIDCLMTTMCTDRPLPDAVNDFRPDYDPVEVESQPGDYGSNWFSRLNTFTAQKYTYTMKANDAEYAKLGIGPLWFEIMEHVRPHLQKQMHDVKLSVFSGHDTTLMPLLAALDPKLWDDKEWPPYASMIVLEIHELVNENDHFPSNFAFRLLYNGNDLTGKIAGCLPELELCDTGVLVTRIESFATLDIDCGRRFPEPAEHIDPVTRTKVLVSTSEGAWYLVALVAVSALFGALVSCLCITGCSLPRCRRRGSLVPSSDVDGLTLTPQDMEDL